MKRWFALLLMCILFPAIAVNAQGNVPSVAFVNGSGQLVIAGADGNTRWIVTNPGEVLHNTLGFSWSPNGRLVFYAVDFGNAVSLRVGDLVTMSVTEIGQVSGQLSGGDWTQSGEVLVASGDTLAAYSAAGGRAILSGLSNPLISSPYSNERPNLQVTHAISPDNTAVFFWDSGTYFLNQSALPGTNDPGAVNSGLWSDRGQVAYWGFAGNGVLSVTDGASNSIVTLDSGSGTPIPPLAWQPGTSNLVYRDGTGHGRIADLSCLSGGCGANPLQNGVDLLPASASEVQIVGNRVYFRDGNNVMGVDLSCVGAGNCLESIFLIGANAAPRTMLHVAENILSYTAFTADANNPADREVRLVDTNCLPGCQPQALLANAVAGLLSPDGAYLMVDVGGNGLHIVRLADLNMVYLSGSMGSLGAGLTTARWSGM